jgi:GcrA cell cycle regulator
MALTDEQLQEAAKMWRDGMSMAQIGNHFNHSRNAIAGYMNRDRDLFPARQSGKGRPRRDGTPARPRPPKPKTWLDRAQKTLAVQDEIAAAIQPPQIQESPSDIPVHVETKDFTALRSFEQLRERECKWPIGDSAFQACGREIVPGKPYCQAHCNLSYMPRKASTKRSYR